MTTEDVEKELLHYIREEFLWGDENNELTVTTPLLEWGIIDSLRTALLLTWAREKYGVHVSPAKVNSRNFRDVRCIAALVTAEIDQHAGEEIVR